MLLILQLHTKAKDFTLHTQNNDPCSFELLLLKQERTRLQLRSVRQAGEQIEG